MFLECSTIVHNESSNALKSHSTLNTKGPRMRRPNKCRNVDKNRGQKVCTHACGPGECGKVGCEGRDPPSSMSPVKAIDASVVSHPLAVPALAPASGTRFMGAFFRSSYPDLTRLLDTDSLLAAIPCDQLHFMSEKESKTYRISAMRSSISYQAREL